MTTNWKATPPPWMAESTQAQAESLCREVSEKSGIAPDALFLRRRGPQNVARTRQLCMALMRAKMSLTFEDIGQYFVGRDHGTVTYAIKAVSGRGVKI